MRTTARLAILALSVLLGCSGGGSGSGGSSAPAGGGAPTLANGTGGWTQVRVDVTGLGNLPQPAPTSSFTLAPVPTGIGTVVVTVKAADISPPISTTLTVSAGQTSVPVSITVPSGVGRSFFAAALSTTNTVLFEGVVSDVTLIAGSSATVTINLGPPQSQLVSSGLTKLGNPNLVVVSADSDFKQAVALSPTDQQANALRAFTRILKLYELPDDGSTNNNSIREFMSRANISLIAGGGTIKNLVRDVFPTPPKNSAKQLVLPPTAPTGQDFQAYLSNVLIPELDGALANLGVVTPSFSLTVAPSQIERADPSISVVEIDYGDVKMFEAFLHGLKAEALTLLAYNANLNLFTINDRTNNNLEINLLNDILTADTALGLPDTAAITRLTTARTELIAGVDAYNAASTFIRAETDDQRDDLIAFIDPDDSTTVQTKHLQEEAEFKARLNEFKNSLSGPVTINSATPVSPKFGNSFQLNLAQFFTVGPVIRSFLPTITGNNHPGSCFPDPTFGGIYPAGTTVNTDIRHPDIDMSLVPSGTTTNPVTLDIRFTDECSGIDQSSIDIQVFGPVPPFGFFGTLYTTSNFTLSTFPSGTTNKRALLSSQTLSTGSSYFMIVTAKDNRGHHQFAFQSFSISAVPATISVTVN